MNTSLLTGRKISLAGAVSSAGGSLGLRLPFTTFGPLIDEDANTVSHIYFDGTQLVDTKGNQWTANGTVPQNAPSQLYPRGFNIGVSGAGPFSDTNYYSLGAGSDILDFAGDFTVCVVVVPLTTDFAGGGVPVSNGTFNIDGWYLQWSNAPLGAFRLTTSSSGASTAVNTSNAGILGAVNIGCSGRAGSTLLAKLNLGPIASIAAGPIVPATTTTAKIGRYAGAGFPEVGQIFEVYITTTTPSDALFTQIQTAFYQNPNNPIVEDQNCVVHVRWNGSQLVDVKKSGWTMNGTVPQANGFLMPSGRSGAGPFSDTNYYSLVSNLLNFAGDFSACFVVSGPPTTAYAVPGGSENYPQSGWYAQAVLTTGTLQAVSLSGGVATVVTTTNSFTVGGLNVACMGRSGTTLYAKLNLGTLATGPGGTIAPATGFPAAIGRLIGTPAPFGTNIYEAWFSTTTPSDALFTQIQQRVFSQYAASGEALTVTRANPTAGSSYDF